MPSERNVGADVFVPATLCAEPDAVPKGPSPKYVLADGYVGIGGHAHEVHEAGVARRRAPRLPRGGGNAEERLRPGLFRVDHIDASARKRCHRRGRGVAGNPHAVGNRLLVDRRSVVRDLARGRVGVGIVRRDALYRCAREEVLARGVLRRRLEVDRVPSGPEGDALRGALRARARRERAEGNEDDEFLHGKCGGWFLNVQQLSMYNNRQWSMSISMPRHKRSVKTGDLELALILMLVDIGGIESWWTMAKAGLHSDFTRKKAASRSAAGRR